MYVCVCAGGVRVRVNRNSNTHILRYVCVQVQSWQLLSLASWEYTLPLSTLVTTVRHVIVLVNR